jgi:hypothetical protein
MSIVPDFAYDLFISYAHVNDQRIAEDDDGWVTDLHDVLSKKLLEEMRVKPRIWRDEGGLDGKQVHQGIAEALQSSAVFLAVVSAAYLESDYCNRELDAFVGQVSPRFPLIVRGHQRLVTAVYDSEEELPRAGWGSARPTAAPLIDAPSAIFCQADPATGRRQRFTKPRRSDPHPYWDAADQLVRHLTAIFGEMRKGPSGTAVIDITAPPPAPASKPPTAWQEVRKQVPGGILVYIPHRAADPSRLRDELRRRNYDLVVLDHGRGGVSERRHQTNLKFCDGVVVVYGDEGVDWAEEVAQEARLAAREQGRPAGVGVLPATSSASDLGLVIDLVVLLEKSEAGAINRLDDFLAMLSRPGRQ